MKYSNEILIQKPLSEVILLFDSEENLFKWQPDLLSFEHVSGQKGKVGAVSKLRYKMGKREIEMKETITVKKLPKEFSAVYEAKGVWNEVSNYFKEVEGDATLWISENHFEFQGFMKLVGWLMPGSFKKQSKQFLERFKAFAEAQ